ncbi:MAG: rod shape-determining protein RodA [Opitutales bacterium]|nr:rod shape-determining protein RodA [Opitutales bacterium]
MALLSLMGLIFIYTSQMYNIDEVSIARQFWFRQSVFLAMGSAVYFFISRMDYEKCFVYAHLIYAACVATLIPLFLEGSCGIDLPFVSSRFNATRWINMGIFSLQPSEIAKIGTCVMVAAILARSKIGTIKESLKVLLKIFIVAAIPILLIFLQPDLGSTLVFPPMIFAMLYVSKLSKRFFISAFAAFAVVVAAVGLDISGYTSFLEKNKISATESSKGNLFGSTHFCLPMKDYQRNRILAFVAPEVVDKRGQDVTWNVRQSLISIGSGGFFGKGLGEGTQAKLGYLPSDVAYNDFIFAVLAEESGFFGATLAIALLAAILLFCCLRSAAKSRDRFGQLLCVGICAMLTTHVFINIGMTVGIMPVTGLPLPMLSYGGSFVLTCFILLGLVQSVYRHRRQFD